ncbi:hypothetical protein SAMN02745910_03315 [Priestia endophytica DSM 13796]|jgi:hypothetical protein|uniref:Uncharacterized protein n=1 Tax=Priestia endophytica DSM 13796 TaxID=1121089 RepID=A0A1I6B6A6_9BACI|nr:hypothetical protein SAMN02745910_03315 [Priestia endophytica DSM 13796]
MFKEGSNIEGVELFSSKEKGKEYVEPLINFLPYIKKMLHQRSIFFMYSLRMFQEL